LSKLGFNEEQISGTGWTPFDMGVSYGTPNTVLDWAENYSGTAQQASYRGIGFGADRAIIVVEIRAAAEEEEPVEIDVPTATTEVAALAPTIATGAAVAVPVAVTEAAGLAPAVAG